MTIIEIARAQAIALGIAFVLDLILGDPNFIFHPVRIMGGEIWLTEKIFRFILPGNKGGEFIAGFLMAVVVVAINAAIPLAILYFAYGYDVVIGIAAEAVICYFMLSSSSLARSSKKVYRALLRGDTEGARRRVSMIVGRDTDRLDDIGITKAAVETVAENTNDGVVAPLLYMAIGGAVLGCVYKAINTMDSMVGYRNDKYMYFGKFAARLDDAANYIPSRIAAIIMIISAAFVRLDAAGAARIHRRDSHNHASPNSAQTESAAAGALRIELAGDAYYFGKLYKKPTIGDALRDVRYESILQVNRLMYMTAFLSAAVFIAAKIAAGYGIVYLINYIQTINI